MHPASHKPSPGRPTGGQLCSLEPSASGLGCPLSGLCLSPAEGFGLVPSVTWPQSASPVGSTWPAGPLSTPVGSGHWRETGVLERPPSWPLGWRAEATRAACPFEKVPRGGRPAGRGRLDQWGVQRGRLTGLGARSDGGGRSSSTPSGQDGPWLALFVRPISGDPEAPERVIAEGRTPGGVIHAEPARQPPAT